MKLTGTFAGRVWSSRACLGLLFALVACAASASGQTPPHVVVETTFPPNQPVELVGAEVAGGAHTLTKGATGMDSVAFDAPEGWLRRLVLKIRNKTDKTILSATLNGTLGLGEEGEIPMGFDLIFGQELDESAFTGRPPRGTPASLGPGQTGDVSWSEAESVRFEKFLATRHPAASHLKVRIYLSDVRFADGTVWTLSGLYRIDPLDPRKWTRVDGQADTTAEPVLKAGERVVEVLPSKPDFDPDVLLITGIEVAGRRVTPGQPFAAGDDWLRGLTLRVRNVSSKPIAYAEIGLSFPEAHYHSGGLGQSLRYGKNFAPGSRSAPDASLLSPGEETELTLTDEEFNSFKAFAERLNGSANFRRVQLGMARVTFADGTRATVINPTRTQKPNWPAAKSN